MTARAYRFVRTRWVHYRTAGKGPLVVLLHGSPQSGAAVAGMIDALVAQGCAALALDTPGNGCSDALPGEPEDIADYARALAETLTSLGVARAALYGFHTGAAHAAAFAGLFPQRVSALALDGFPVWTEVERADLLAHYLPPFAPQWDGGHLTWAWARMEAQSVYFPWYAQRDDARMAQHAVPEPAQMHDNVLDLLRAGDRYRAPYASAFRCDGRALLAHVQAPTMLCAGSRDPLAAHLARLDGLPPAKRRTFGADRPTAWAAMAQWLASHATDPAPEWPHPAADTQGVIRSYVGARRVYRLGDGPDRPIVRVHAPGRSIEACLAGAMPVAHARPVILAERRLHGESGDDGTSVEDVLRALGASDAEVSREDGPAVPDVTPRWDGAHLSTAWRHAWRRALFEPWDAPDASHARHSAPDTGAIHAHATDILKAWRAR